MKEASRSGGRSWGVIKRYERKHSYDCGTRRFTQTDPIGFGGGLNLYGFAGGDPVNYADPFGLKLCLKGNVAEAAKALKEATGTDFKLTAGGCVREESVNRVTTDGFGAIFGRFSAIVSDQDKDFSLTVTWGGFDSRGHGDSGGGFAIVGGDVTGGAYARPGDRCRSTVNWDLASVVVHELLGHSFAGAYASRKARDSQTGAIAIENRYHAAAGRPQRDPSCG